MFNEIKLKNSEVLNAAILGSIRNIQSWKQAVDKHGANTEKDGWQLNIMACLSEMAWAKLLNLYYNASIGNYQDADVNGYYQLRSSSIAYRHNACLRIHKADDDDKPYILSLVGVNQVIFPGWLWGYEGKKDQYWCDKWGVGRPAFFIDQSNLKPIDELIN